jgi:hypothetical protein
LGYEHGAGGLLGQLAGFQTVGLAVELELFNDFVHMRIFLFPPCPIA